MDFKLMDFSTVWKETHACSIDGLIMVYSQFGDVYVIHQIKITVSISAYTIIVNVYTQYYTSTIVHYVVAGNSAAVVLWNNSCRIQLTYCKICWAFMVVTVLGIPRKFFLEYLFLHTSFV